MRSTSLNSPRSTFYAIAPPLVFGLRMWVAVCLALTVAFWLELDNAMWAGATAAIVSQPVLGASLRKGWFRIIGTVVGAVAAVAISAWFPQNRLGLLLILAVWAGCCAALASVLRNAAAYAAALAGFTAVVVCGDQLGAVGGLNGDAFMLAITRSTEICIGAVAAGIVLAGSDFGRARRQLATALADMSSEITSRLIESLRLGPSDQLATATVRRELTRRVAALDAIIDTARGEAPELRFNPQPLQAAVGGLFSALSAWSAIANHLASLPQHQCSRLTADVLQRLPSELRLPEVNGDRTAWRDNPERFRVACMAAVRSLLAFRASGPSQRLLADGSAEALLAVRRALDGLVLLRHPHRAVPRRNIGHRPIADWLPPILNGVRASITIGTAATVWIVTAWPGGEAMLVYAAIILLLMSRGDDQARHAAHSMLMGGFITIVVVGIIGYAVLPTASSYVSFCMALGLILIPLGALSAQSWRPQLFSAANLLIMPLLLPANHMSYNIGQFYNSAIAMIVGISLATLVLQVIPPPSPTARSRRLLILMRRDLRRMASGDVLPTHAGWEGRVHARLAAMPAQADPMRWAWLTANQTVGNAIIRLSAIANRFGLTVERSRVLAAFARSDSAAIAAALTDLEVAIAAGWADFSGKSARLRASAIIQVLSETLIRHAIYFGAP